MPLTALAFAVAVNAVASELLAVSELKALGVLNELSDCWNVESALCSVPRAEILAVTALV